MTMNENLQVWLRWISLPRTAVITLRWFWLHISTFQYKYTTRVTQSNLIATCFARKSILRQRCIFGSTNCNQKLAGAMTKKTKESSEKVRTLQLEAHASP